MDKAEQRAQWLQEVDEAKRIAEILADDTVKAVLGRMESSAIQEWRDTEDYSKSLQSDGWHKLRMIDDFKAALQSIVTTGQMAAANLEALKRGQS